MWRGCRELTLGGRDGNNGCSICREKRVKCCGLDFYVRPRECVTAIRAWPLHALTKRISSVPLISETREVNEISTLHIWLRLTSNSQMLICSDTFFLRWFKCRVPALYDNILSILILLLFSFDQDTRVDESLMQNLACQLSCNSCSRLTRT